MHAQPAVRRGASAPRPHASQLRSHSSSSRYTAAGTVGTPAGGGILVVRYDRGRRVELTIPINETTADLKTQAVLAGLRVEF